MASPTCSRRHRRMFEEPMKSIDLYRHVKSGNYELASRMSEQGVSVDMEDSNGMSPLFHAINK